MANLRDVAGIQFELIGFSPGGDALLCELASRARGVAGGVPLRWTTFAVLRVRERRIARVEAFLSREEALAAAGKPG
jgi:ketosteroid isomerase-like protein